MACAAGASDPSRAQMEFAVYAVFLASAIDKHEPGYFQACPQFRAYLAHELRRSTDQWRGSQAFPCYRWPSNLPAAVRANPQAQAIVRKLYGEALSLDQLFAEQHQLELAQNLQSGRDQ